MTLPLKLHFRGEVRTLSEVAGIVGIRISTLGFRLRRGLTLDEATSFTRDQATLALAALRPPKPTDRERFDAQVDRSGECWVWTGTKNRLGYGAFRLDGHRLNASRAAWILAHGPLRRDVHVCHRCDNPPCVRLDHLFVGSAADNQRDARSKWRGTFGETHPNAVLSGEQVRLVRDLFQETRPDLVPLETGGRRKHLRRGSLRVISAATGVPPKTVSHIIRSSAWAHLRTEDDVPSLAARQSKGAA